MGHKIKVDLPGFVEAYKCSFTEPDRQFLVEVKGPWCRDCNILAYGHTVEDALKSAVKQLAEKNDEIADMLKTLEQVTAK